VVANSPVVEICSRVVCKSGRPDGSKDHGWLGNVFLICGLSGTDFFIPIPTYEVSKSEG